MGQGVQHSEGWFDSEYGDHVYYQSWVPDGDAHTSLLIVHGLAEHGGRYQEFAEFFTSAGFAVHALDHPGHGKSAGARGHIRSFSEFTGTLDRHLAVVKESNPGRPIVLVGHSMGGLIATAFLIDQQAEFAAAVLSGAAIRAPQQPSGCAILINRFIARLLPRLGVLQLDSSGVSRDPEVVEKYDNDPLVFRGKVSARLAAEIFPAMDNVLARAAEIRIPMLIMHGSADALTDVNGSKLLYEAISSERKELKIYDGLYHEIYNEPEKVAVMTDVKNWLERTI